MTIEKVSNYAQQLFDIKTLFEHLLTSAVKNIVGGLFDFTAKC